MRGRRRKRTQTTASAAATTTATVVLTEMMTTVVVESGGGARHAAGSSEGEASAPMGAVGPDASVRAGVPPNDECCKKEDCPAGRVAGGWGAFGSATDDSCASGVDEMLCGGDDGMPGCSVPSGRRRDGEGSDADGEVGVVGVRIDDRDANGGGGSELPDVWSGTSGVGPGIVVSGSGLADVRVIVAVDGAGTVDASPGCCDGGSGSVDGGKPVVSDGLRDGPLSEGDELVKEDELSESDNEEKTVGGGDDVVAIVVNWLCDNDEVGGGETVDREVDRVDAGDD